jgi:periplasmic copper chaperone A
MSAIFKIPRRAALAAGVALALAGAAGAGAAGPLTFAGAWTRPAAAGQTGAGYLSIANNGRTSDRLIAASSPAAAKVSIHQSLMVGSLATMRTLPSLAIPAGGAAVFRPGGLHLMLEGLKRPLKAGQRLAVTLVFARAGRRAVTLQVRDGPPGRPMAGMKM